MQSIEFYQDRPEFPTVVEMANRSKLEASRDSQVILELSGLDTTDTTMKAPEVVDAITKSKIPLFFRAIDGEIQAGDYEVFLSEAIDEIPNDFYVTTAQNLLPNTDQEDLEFGAVSIEATVRGTLTRGAQMQPIFEDAAGEYAKLYTASVERSSAFGYPPGIVFRNPVLFEDVYAKTFEPNDFADTNIDRISQLSLPSFVEMIIAVKLDTLKAQREYEENEELRTHQGGEDTIELVRLLLNTIMKNLRNASYREQEKEAESLRSNPILISNGEQMVERTINAGIVAVGGEVIRFWGQAAFDELDPSTRDKIDLATQSLKTASPLEFTIS